MTLTTIQLLVFVSYIAFLYVEFRHPIQSISDSWYLLGYPKNILFGVFLFLLGLTTMMQKGEHTYLFQIGGAGLWLVGVFEPFRSKFKIAGSDSFIGNAHVIGATGCVISCLLALIIDRHTFVPLEIFGGLFVLISLLNPINKTWWMELSAFTAIIIGLFLTA